MQIPSEVLQFLGSLVAIFALAGLAWWMKLGGVPKLADDADAMSAACEVHDGYTPTSIALDTNGHSAILLDASERIMVLKPHGNKIAGRILTSAASAYCEDKQLFVDTGERRFGSVTMQIGDADAWVTRINAIRVNRDA